MKPHRAHGEVRVDDLLRQLARERVVVMLDRVRHNEILPVRAEGAPLGEKRRKAPVVPGIVGRAGVHHAETEPTHLMGKQTEPVPAAVLRAVALAPDGAAERVDRVAHHAEKALVVHLARLAGIERCELAVERILRHAHIARLDAVSGTKRDAQKRNTSPSNSCSGRTISTRGSAS